MIRAFNVKYLFFQFFGLGMIIFLLLQPKSLKKKMPVYTWEGVIAQSDSYSCGAAALAMVFVKHDLKVPLMEIERAIVKPWKGCTMLDLKSYAQMHGINSTGWELRFEELRKINMPSIVSVRGSHFLVIDSINKDVVYFRDPLRGSSTISRDDFLVVWDRNAIEFSVSIEGK